MTHHPDSQPHQGGIQLPVTHAYDDIISLPHPEPNPRRHPRMSLQARAAQFAPFAALTGYSDTLADTADRHIADANAEQTEADPLLTLLDLMADAEQSVAPPPPGSDAPLGEI